MTDSLLEKFDFRYYLQVIYRRKWLIIIPVILSICLAIFWIVNAVPKYESKTVIRVSYNQSVVSKSVERLMPGARTVGAATVLSRNIITHDNLIKLINILNLKEDSYSDPIKLKAEKMLQTSPDRSLDELVEVLLIDELKKDLQVRQSRKDFIEIKGKGISPDQTYLMVETLASLFIENVLREELSGISSSLEFSSEQLEIYRNKLEQSERRLERYKQQLAVTETEQVTDIALQITKADSIINSIDELIKENESDLGRINVQLGRQYQNISLPSSAQLTQAKNNLINDINRLSYVSMTSSWKDGESIRLNKEIRDLREQMEMIVETLIRSELNIEDETVQSLLFRKQMILLDIDLYESRKVALLNIKNNNKTKLEERPTISLNLNRLEQEISAFRSVYELFLDQARGSEIEHALQEKEAEYKLKIIEPAQKPIHPVEPRKKRILVVCLLLGLMIGATGVYGLEYIDRSYKDVLAVEKDLNLPVLGIVPKLDFLKETES